MTVAESTVTPAEFLQLFMQDRRQGILRYLPSPGSEDVRGTALFDIYDIREDGTVEYEVRAHINQQTAGWGNMRPHMKSLDKLDATGFWRLIRNGNLRLA